MNSDISELGWFCQKYNELLTLNWIIVLLCKMDHEWTVTVRYHENLYGMGGSAKGLKQNCIFEG
jgi:hypothetical protein